MTKISSAKDPTTDGWVVTASINGKEVGRVTGPAERVSERDCFLRLAEILLDKLDAVGIACSAKAEAGLPEVR